MSDSQSNVKCDGKSYAKIILRYVLIAVIFTLFVGGAFFFYEYGFPPSIDQLVCAHESSEQQAHTLCPDVIIPLAGVSAFFGYLYGCGAAIQSCEFGVKRTLHKVFILGTLPFIVWLVIILVMGIDSFLKLNSVDLLKEYFLILFPALLIGWCANIYIILVSWIIASVVAWMKYFSSKFST